MTPSATPRRMSRGAVEGMLDEHAVRRVYEALGARELRSGGPGNWLTRSPLRSDDDRPSFTINRSNGLWHDHATGEGGSIFDAVMRAQAMTFPESLAFVLAHANSTLPPTAVGAVESPAPPRRLEDLLRHVTAIYPYEDEQGTLLYEVLRHEPPAGGKRFSVRRPPVDGEPSQHGWVWSARGQRRVLYRLPELLAANPGTWVFVTEGEKDVDRLREQGFTATTNAFGSAAWNADYAPQLSGHDVVVLPDNDRPGMERAAIIARSLQGHARSVRVVTLPDLPQGGDVCDWLDDGHQPWELEELVLATKPVVSATLNGPAVATPATSSGAPAQAPFRPRAVISRLSEVTPQQVHWLWESWLPLGKLSILGGHPGQGKSTLAASFAAILSRGADGGCWPDGSSVTTDPAASIFLLAEDGVADTLAPRLNVLNADMERIVTIDAVEHRQGEETYFSLAEHLDVLEDTIVREGAKLVVIDPLSAFLPNRNRNDEGDIRDLMTPLGKLAERCQVAILGIMHVGKPSTARRTALQSLLGATAFGAIARSVLMAAPVPESQRGALAVIKSNLAGKPAAVEWTRTDDGGIDWHGASAIDVESLLGGGGAESAGPRETVEELLVTLLHDGPVLVSDIEQAIDDAGYSRATLQRARKNVGVRSERIGGRNGNWYLMLQTADWKAFLKTKAADAVAEVRERESANDAAPKPPPVVSLPSVTHTCLECRAPCGSAARCSGCAAALVPVRTR